MSTRYGDIVRIEKAPGTQFCHDFRQAGAGHSETAFAATGHAEMGDCFVADVPGTMDNNRSGEGVAIGQVQSLKPDRMTMGTDIGGTCSIGSCRARVRAWLIGETLQPPRMQGVGAPPMRDQMRAYAAVGEVHQVEPRRMRGQGEVRDADKISVRDAVAVPFQRVERAPKQGRRQWATDTIRSLNGGSSDGRGGSHTGQRETEKMTTGICQDVKFLLR